MGYVFIMKFGEIVDCDKVEFDICFYVEKEVVYVVDKFGCLLFYLI